MGYSGMGRKHESCLKGEEPGRYILPHRPCGREIQAYPYDLHGRWAGPEGPVPMGENDQGAL